MPVPGYFQPPDKPGIIPGEMPACGHMREQQPMIAVNENCNLQQVFSEFLLIGDIFTPSGMEHEQQRLHEILEKCGFAIVRSECTILENNHIGDSVITIARFSLEYRKTGDASGKIMYFEGDLTMQVDRRGRMSIALSTNPGVSPPVIDPIHANGSLLSNTLKTVPFISSHMG